MKFDREYRAVLKQGKHLQQELDRYHYRETIDNAFIVILSILAGLVLLLMACVA